MPNRRTLPVAVGLTVAAAVVAGSVVGLGSGGFGGDPETTADPTSVSEPAPTSPASPTPSGAPDARAGSPRTGDRSEESRPGTTSAPAPASSPASTPASTPAPSDGAGVEVIPPDATAAPSEHLPGLDDPDATIEPPDWRDLPDETAVAQGRLATGYPTSLLPLAPRAAVLTSSVSPSEHRVQVALVARRQDEPSAVLGFYRRTLLRAGFAEVRAPEVGGAASASFRHGPDRVVITVDPGSARTYSVYGTFDTDEA